MSNPPAGWYPDPENSGQQRWWDSVQWGPQFRPAFQAPPPPPAAIAGGTTTRLRKTNGIGFAGAVVGLASLLINPLLLASLVGILLCLIGLMKDDRMRKADAPVFGRGWIIAGLVASVISAALYGAVLIQSIARGYM